MVLLIYFLLYINCQSNVTGETKYVMFIDMDPLKKSQYEVMGWD